MGIVNLGILAHVDAGKTTLTERILFETGLIGALGSVDKGTTQTDTLELERARGISIKSAVVSFNLHQLKVNLIDTPGHADFVAEVARSLGVLDAVVLVVSAVEGVQPQTRRLARAIRAARLPLLIFVNKIDRLGARGDALLPELCERLRLRVVPLNAAGGLGERGATVIPHDRDRPAWREPVVNLLAETSERVIAEFERTGGEPSRAFVEDELRAQVAAGDIAPVCFGSAITGAGVAQLLAAVEEWLPRAREALGASAAGKVFKIARRPAGEKIVYARLVAGSLAVRQHVTLHRRDPFGEIEAIEERITGIDRFESGAARPVEAAGAGEIVALHGLRATRIGDWIGACAAVAQEEAESFPPPAFESVVRPREPGQLTRLRAALEELAEQDPLISLRQRNEAGEIGLRLYGEVQKEVVQETLAHDYGVAVAFGPTQTICVERPAGTGEHAEFMGEGGNPYYATLGLRIERGEPESGLRYRHEPGSLPPSFYRAIEETVRETCEQGLMGWRVTDCAVTLTQVGYSSVVSTAGDFRKLTPLVLMRALAQAGTEVCEPIDELELELPEDCFGAVCGLLLTARAAIRQAARDGAGQRLICAIPSAELRGVEQQLPGLTRGEAGWESHLAGYAPVSGEPPRRRRTGPDPLNRAHYLAEAARA
ncbi:MAG TPA: translation factor GTPase family protein [Thermomicrobiaceae bacterium]|nr:translation factor GTPase family protein [Thermomicrobiaceae bacterium]